MFFEKIKIDQEEKKILGIFEFQVCLLCQYDSMQKCFAILEFLTTDEFR